MTAPNAMRVVLLRGLMREHGHWGSFPDQLALQLQVPRDQVLTPDLPGNGWLHQQPSPTRLAGNLDAIRWQLRQAWGEQAGPVHVLALSMGGMVATQWAHQHPTELASMTLVSSSMRPFSPFWDRLQPGLWPAIGKVIWHHADAQRIEQLILSATANAATPGLLADWVAIRRQRPVSVGNALRQLWAAARYRAPDTPPPVPCLVLSGQADRVVHPRCSAAIAKAWGARHFSHPDAGHDLPIDAPAWLMARWCDFLDLNELLPRPAGAH